MDLFVCFNCNTVVDADKCREGYIGVCPMDTADAGYVIGYRCSNCGCFIVRRYVDDAPDGAKEGDKVCHKNLKKIIRKLNNDIQTKTLKAKYDPEMKE